MKKLFFAAAAALLITCGCSKTAEQTASYDVIPLPNTVEANPSGGDFHLTGSTVIVSDESLRTEAEHLQGYLETLTGHKLKITDEAPEKDAIILQTDLESENPEAYNLNVNADRILINGASAAGTFYGIQTLRKSVPMAEKSNVTFPGVNITDEPRFAYRGAHFDVARHFFPADSVKTFIDMLALHNINRLHWHLTDDQGWRVEIKSRPELIEIGSKRPNTVIGHNTEDYDTIPVEGYYTQEEIKDIIKYASDRHIVIVPEIDLPGHMVAALTAYPELGCTGGPYEVFCRWGVTDDVLCAGNDSTYKFLEDVLGEVADLFPSEYIHIGGDESPKIRWEVCKKCQAKIAELGLKNDAKGTKEQKLQSYVTTRMSEFLASKGKKIIGWDEILEGGLAPGAVVMSWRGEEGGIEAAKQGHDVIMTPNTYLYFDYYQTLDQANEPDAIGGYIPLEKVYGYEPISDVFTPEEAAHIIGVQANLWTEYIKTFRQAQYMELPRMAALSEVQWSKTPKNYQAFMNRLPRMFTHYEINGYNYSNRAFDVVELLSVDPENSAVVIEFSTAGDSPIYYTLDGTEPDENANLYDSPVSVDKSVVIKAVAIHPQGKGRVLTDSLKFSKSTAQAVTLETQPNSKYVANGPQTLVDGKFGRDNFGMGGWLGYTGNDLVAVIDFLKPTEISKVSANALVDTVDWIFDAKSFKAEVSDDGKTWREIASEQYPVMQSDLKKIVNHALNFAPVNTRYLKVTIESEKVIPEWHGAKGQPGFVFVDEIVVE